MKWEAELSEKDTFLTSGYNNYQLFLVEGNNFAPLRKRCTTSTDVNQLHTGALSG